MENNDRDLLLMAVFTFFTVALWIFFELVKTAKTTTVTTTQTQVLAPFNPTIDTDVVNMLANRVNQQ